MADLDVVVVGAGFAGIYAVHALRSSGLTVRAFEAGGGIGGTWFWNSYPGARCDVESKDYSFSFSPSSSRNGRGASATRPSRRSCGTSATSPTGSGCGRISS